MSSGSWKRRRRRSSSSSSSPPRRDRTSSSRRRRDDGDDGIVDFERHRSKLAKIFFREEDVIKQGSDEYRDFWKFLRKYQAMERQRMERGEGRRRQARRAASFELLPTDTRDLLNRIPFQDADDREGYLSEAAVQEFRHIFSLYVDFLQRERFSKLRKLREAQAGLPIAEYRSEILRKLEENQVVIVAGDTGCGKSTQVPQYLLQAGYEGVACTQPRRIACISLAKRVGFETLNEYGSEIGYQIRFERKKTDRTKVLFLTEGLLLRQVSSDPALSAYSVVVLDEVHERHLHGDFLLGVVKCLVQQRDDLKVVLMSATINIKLFQDYFHGEAPVVQVPGRLYPIKLQYMPVPAIEKSSTEKLNPAPYVRILQLIDRKYAEKERGDVLIFLSGLKEITAVADACKEYADTTKGRWIVLSLHSTLSLAEQDKVFDYPPEGTRKCIISTNIAETSVTIDGVRFVVDSGKVKEMQHDPVCKMQRLKEFWVSRASAEQRKGRAGRTGPGVCFRLYEESEYKALAAYATPEIQRVSLDTLVLQMLSMGLPDARKFPFIEPPSPESMENAILALKEQGALNDDESLTVMGRTLANLPVDVSVGKMLIMGTLFHQVESVLSLAAALSVQSPFTNNAYRDSDCVAARRNLDSDHGDPITLLNAYREWLQIKADRSENTKKWCRNRGLEEQRFYEMTKLRQQFKDLLEQAGLMKKDEADAMARMTSSERASRHGELKQLRDMKREQLLKEGPRKKKILKLRDGLGAAAIDAEDDGEVDLRDIEFRMRHDGRQVRHLLEGTRAYTYKDLTMLKLIVTAGLYPQLAVADEFNSAKPGSDQMFHTRVKPFNILHPNCIFAANPDYVTLDTANTVQVAGFPAKYPVSSKHQILIYLSLLETNKPYVMNAMRMPALQTLLLFSHSIDTNAGLSRLVFDSWLEVRFPSPEEGQNMLLRAAILRRYWDRLLNSRLLECLEESSERSGLGLKSESSRDPVATAEEQAALESRLSHGLVDFIHSEANFSLRRLLPADIKVAYVGPGENCAFPPDDGGDVGSAFDPEFPPRPNEKKGGFLLAQYLTFDCLEERAEEVSAKLHADWTCSFCQEGMFCGPLARLRHYARCLEREEADRRARGRREAEEEGRATNPRARQYHCPECDRDFAFTAIEILKHKRSHRD